jgi:hypothetical protein
VEQAFFQVSSHKFSSAEPHALAGQRTAIETHASRFIQPYPVQRSCLMRRSTLLCVCSVGGLSRTRLRRLRSRSS